MKKSGKEVFLRGIVVVSDWEDDNSTGLAIQTQDEEEILISESGMGEELFDYIREDIELRGSLRETESGMKEIVVSHYNVIDWDEI